MSQSPIVTSTLQSAILSGVSNVLAQIINSYRHETPLSIDWIPVLQFVLFGIINTPPNYLWQEFIERTFPSHPSPAQRPKTSDEKQPKDKQPSEKQLDEKESNKEQPQEPLSRRNTAIKFLLDQSIGAAVNTLLFSVFMHSLHAAMPNAPRITNPRKAIDYWTSTNAIDFTRVDFNVVFDAALGDFWHIVFAGFKLWPAVSLLNFTCVKTVQGRNLVGAVAGVVWNIYMSFVAAR